jgi:hypothetical protein
MINNNQWHHLAMVWNKATGRYVGYVDGVSVGQSGIVTAYGGIGTVKVGAQGDGSGAFFKGSIDDVRIYNRILSVEEIEALYRATE